MPWWPCGQWPPHPQPPPWACPPPAPREAGTAAATWLLDRPATNPVIRCSAGMPHAGQGRSSSRRNPCRNTSNSSEQEGQRRSYVGMASAPEPQRLLDAGTRHGAHGVAGELAVLEQADEGDALDSVALGDVG